ncbi:MAG: FAD-dependent monooxygenase, partial [Hyphomicrobiales bacterium]|nr:FAD-dependent monooxygenase [Hyphomicrobiales bacterium]
MATRPAPHDLLIAGAGPVGLAIAALAARDAGASVVVCDPAPSSKPDALRVSTLAPDSVALVADLGAWDALAPHAAPVAAMSITDSTLDEPVRREFLRFDGEDGAPLAHVVENARVAAALRERCSALGVAFRRGAVTAMSAGPAAADVTLSDGTAARARLVVAADGADSALRTGAGLKALARDYAQVGIVATLTHEFPHDGTAVQHFLPGGPFALLPLTENRSSIVWTEDAAVARGLMRGDQARVVEAIRLRAGTHLGVIE